MNPTLKHSTSHLTPHINVKLALLGFQPVNANDSAEFADVISTLVAQYREKERLLANHLCPADHRIQAFLYDYLDDVAVTKLPLRTFTLDKPGMARVLSLPERWKERSVFPGNPRQRTR